MKDTAEQKKESTKKIKAFSELHTVEPDQEKDEILSYILTDDFKEKYGPVLAYSLIHRENNKYYVPTSLGFFQITGDGDDNHVERIENPSLDHENDPVIGDVYSRLEKTEAGRPRQSNKNKLCIGDLDPYLQYIVGSIAQPWNWFHPLLIGISTTFQTLSENTLLVPTI